MSEQRTAEASRLTAVSELVQPTRITLDTDICTLGRSSVCDVVVDLETVSRIHAKIERDVVRYVLYDTNSANGTFVNGQRVTGSQLLRSVSGDITLARWIRISIEFKFCISISSVTTR